MQIVHTEASHLRLKDNDIIITLGASWEHIQENPNIGKRFSGGSDAHDAVVARHLFAPAKQLAQFCHSTPPQRQDMPRQK